MLRPRPPDPGQGHLGRHRPGRLHVSAAAPFASSFEASSLKPQASRKRLYRWRRNPIPGCKAPNGGAFGESCGPNNGTHPGDYQFPPAGEDRTRPGQLLGGFGAGGCYGAPYGAGCGQPGMPNPSPSGDLTKIWDHIFHFNIVDTLRVPLLLEAGEYILSFRWVSERIFEPPLPTGCSLCGVVS